MHETLGLDIFCRISDVDLLFLIVLIFLFFYSVVAGYCLAVNYESQHFTAYFTKCKIVAYLFRSRMRFLGKRFWKACKGMIFGHLQSRKKGANIRRRKYIISNLRKNRGKKCMQRQILAGGCKILSLPEFQRRIYTEMLLDLKCVLSHVFGLKRHRDRSVVHKMAEYWLGTPPARGFHA